jgi:hypothetical protein
MTAAADPTKRRKELTAEKIAVLREQQANAKAHETAVQVERARRLRAEIKRIVQNCRYSQYPSDRAVEDIIAAFKISQRLN